MKNKINNNNYNNSKVQVVEKLPSRPQAAKRCPCGSVYFARVNLQAWADCEGEIVVYCPSCLTIFDSEELEVE